MKHGQLFLFQGDSITDCQRHRESQDLVNQSPALGNGYVGHLAGALLAQEAVKEAPPEYWAEDGVHPTPAGHARMATFWRSRLGI
jgi:hypothetical protein